MVGFARTALTSFADSLAQVGQSLERILGDGYKGLTVSKRQFDARILVGSGGVMNALDGFNLTGGDFIGARIVQDSENGENRPWLHDISSSERV